MYPNGLGVKIIILKLWEVITYYQTHAAKAYITNNNHH